MKGHKCVRYPEEVEVAHWETGSWGEVNQEPLMKAEELAEQMVTQRGKGGPRTEVESG